MHGLSIRIGIDRYGGDTHLARGPDDAAGNFASIGDQNFRKHAGNVPVSELSLYGFRRPRSSRQNGDSANSAMVSGQHGAIRLSGVALA
jgi:hypothetical protein